jgi:hypothetical protein
MLGSTSEDAIRSLFTEEETVFSSGAKTQQIVLYLCAASKNEET